MTKSPLVGKRFCTAQSESVLQGADNFRRVSAES
jgi:hypothetical protein